MNAPQSAAERAALPESALVRPAWASPPGVGALMTTRAGGVSRGVLASLNLGGSVGDATESVAENRRRFAASLRLRAGAGEDESLLPARPVWLRQVHGVHVLELDRDTPEHPEVAADAAWTRDTGIACVVGAADCLPVLLAASDGSAVAAAHAGWRGLAAGVLEATVGALERGAGVRAGELLAWLGPCIGPRHFEVGADVLQAFGVDAAATTTTVDAPGFRYAPRPDGAARWRADLRDLARLRLQGLGVRFIAASDACTYDDESRFFSFRRDGRDGRDGRGGSPGPGSPSSPSGRMAAAIWLQAGLASLGAGRRR